VLPRAIRQFVFILQQHPAPKALTSLICIKTFLYIRRRVQFSLLPSVANFSIQEVHPAGVILMGGLHIFS
jgi:hypothetical protein